MNEGQRPDPSRLAAAVIALLEPELATEGLDLLDVRVFRGGGRLQLRIYLDTFDGGTCSVITMIRLFQMSDT